MQPAQHSQEPPTPKELYGHPFASSKDWSPGPADYQLSALPSVDLVDRIKQRFARSPGNPFDPPAPSFARPVPRCGTGAWPLSKGQRAPAVTYSSFRPFSLASKDKKAKLAGDGFKGIFPGPVMVDHNVSVADWERFLEDLEVAGRLSGAQRIITEVAPITAHMGATGFFVTRAVQGAMRKKKEPAVAEVMETWSLNFFAPRGLDIYIARGPERLTARWPHEAIPLAPVARELNLQRVHSSSSSSSGDKRHHRKHDKHGGKSKKHDKHKSVRDRLTLVVEPLPSLAGMPRQQPAMQSLHHQQVYHRQAYVQPQPQPQQYVASPPAQYVPMQASTGDHSRHMQQQQVFSQHQQTFNAAPSYRTPSNYRGANDSCF